MTSKRIVPLSEYHRLPQEAQPSDFYKRLLEVVCNNATLALFIMDERQECVYMNPAAETLTGYSLSETKGRSLHDVIHHTRPDGRPYPLCECPIDQAFPQNNQEQGEEVFVHKDGHFYPVAYTASPIREGASVIGTIIEVRNITQEKLAEQARQEAERREQALQTEAELIQRRITHLLEHMSDAFIMLDSEWRIVYQNVEAERLNQKPKSEVLGKTHWEEWPTSVGTNVEAQYRRAMAEQVAVHFEHHYYVPPNYDYWLEIDAYPLEDGLGIFYRNISDRKQVEKDLRESERRFRRLVESNMFGVAFGDFAGGMHYANDYFLNLVGYTREEVESGQVQWMTITPPEYLPLDEAAGKELKAKGVATPFEKEYIRKDGTRVPILIGATLLDEPYEQAQEIITFYLDLSERKQVEAAWREGKQTLDAIMEYIPEGITIADAPDVTIRQVSKYGQQLTGRASEVITNIPFTEHVEKWGLLRPDGSQPTGEELPLTRATQQGQIVIGEEWILQRADKTQVYISCNAGPIRNEAGHIMGGVIAWRDITDGKRAELEIQKFVSLADNSGEFIGMCDMNFVPFYVNEAGRQLVGLEDVQQYSQTPVREFFFPEDQDFIIHEFFPRVLSQGRAEVEIRFRHFKTGEAVWMIYNVFYIRGVNGQPIGLASVSRNIADRKRIEAEREQLLTRERAARAAAERANRVKDEFLAIVSHELRSPLNPILGWSRLLQEQKLDQAKTTQALSTIARNAKLQAELIEDLLDVSRILQGKLSLSISPIDLRSTIQAALETVRLSAEAKSIQIHQMLQSDVGLVSGDSTRLQQVVWNLLSNAIKFTPLGGRVDIRLECLGSMAQITIRDTGKGIHPDFLPHVFDYFRQEDGATTRKFGGLGLGLAIVHHLVELHGGTVQAESPGEGQGATFTVTLPLIPTSSQSTPDSSPSEPTLDLTGIKVLVVDDDTDTRDFVAFLLEQSGAQVVTSASASEALVTLARFHPDVLLSDIGMPEVDGYMLLRQVRALPPEQGGQIPAIALTAYAGEIDYQQAMIAGFQKHLAKPIEPQMLIQAISVLYNSQGTASLA